MMKNQIAITNGVIFTGNNVYTHKSLLIEGDYIYDIVDDINIPPEFQKIDVAGKNICPGLIDLQIYGAGDYLFSAELTTNSIHHIEQSLLQQGCTSFYLTLATNTINLFKKAIEVYKLANPRVSLGLHLEGPFLNSLKRGAHPEDLVLQPTVEALEDLLSNHEGSVSMMTIAPERIDEECLAYLENQDVLISAGHSNATFHDALNSFDIGVKTVTHLWNAMSPFHHRNAGLPGAAFAHSSVRASVIVDGIHVDYDAVKISKALMKERLFLITDAVVACNKSIYQHVLNGDHYMLPNGTLSGSALTMLKAIENCVNYVNITLDEAIRMATLYPADLIGRTDIGRLEKGALANVLIFDSSFKVDSVFFEGQKVR